MSSSDISVKSSPAVATKKRVHNPYAYSYECIRQSKEARREQELLLLKQQQEQFYYSSTCTPPNTDCDNVSDDEELFRPHRCADQPDGASSESNRDYDHYTTTQQQRFGDSPHFLGGSPNTYGSRSLSLDDDQYDSLVLPMHSESGTSPINPVTPPHQAAAATPLPCHTRPLQRSNSNNSNSNKVAPPAYVVPPPFPVPPVLPTIAGPPPAQLPFSLAPSAAYQNLPSRNKGVVCKRFAEGGDTQESGATTGCRLAGVCPYRHVAATFEEPVPRSTCRFFLNGSCLRDSCPFFHGTAEKLREIQATGSATYRPAAACEKRDAEIHRA